jgi:hypothetical protein
MRLTCMNEDTNQMTLNIILRKPVTCQKVNKIYTFTLHKNKADWLMI